MAQPKTHWASTELTLGIALCVVFLAMLLFQQPLQIYDPAAGNLDERFLPIGSAGHWLGTDNLGRDLWSRVLEGLSWSVAAALIATGVAALLGLAAGLLAASFPGWVRELVRQIVDGALSFPGLLAAIVVVATIGRGFWPLTLTLGFLTWPVFARVVYSETVSLLSRDYVTASRLAGASTGAILLRHVVPALRPSLAVMLAFHFGDMLVAESALSFLGLGAPLGVPTWGNLLQESRDFLFVAPWLMAIPAIAIVLLVVAANLLGDGIRKLS